MHVVAHGLIGGPNSLGGQSREKGGNLAPYDDIWGQKVEQDAPFIPNTISSYWETIGRLGELVLMLENLIK